MTRSRVFFTDFHARPGETLPQKLHRLMKTAGFETIDFSDRYTAIKIHFGELGNLAHLRPQYAKVVGGLMRSANRLEWFDLLTGQGDRHGKNYMVDVSEDGTVSRMRIDVLGTERVVDQIMLQLRNCVNVIEVTSRHIRDAAQ